MSADTRYELHFCNPIPGLDGYFTSSAGTVFSNKRHGGQLRELSSRTSVSGYLAINLYKKTYPVHVLVARAWLANPLKLPFVNHKDGNKQNNDMENLEYVSSKENNRHAREVLKFDPHRRPVCQLSLDGTLIRKYKSLKEAQDITGAKSRAICQVCQGKRRHTFGYVWCYEEDFKNQPMRRSANCKPVLQYDMYSGKLLAKFESVKEAARHVGALAPNISNACTGISQSCKGYHWSLEEKQEKKDETADWVVLEAYPLYKISRDGRVFSSWTRRLNKFTDVSGYKIVSLTNPEGVSRKMYVHRLVAMAYLPNPNNYPIVNHKDGNPSNNAVENVEWVTQSQNVQHAHDTGLNKASKAVIKYDKKGNELARYKSVTSAAKSINLTLGTVSKACHGISKTSGGYHWKFA